MKVVAAAGGTAADSQAILQAPGSPLENWPFGRLFSRRAAPCLGRCSCCDELIIG